MGGGLCGGGRRGHLGDYSGRMAIENSPTHFADRWFDLSEKRGGPVCVGIDPVYERLPDELRKHAADPADQVAAIEKFSLAVIESVADHVPMVKIQSACYERYWGPGVAAYHRVIAAAQAAGLLVIADAKRGDIGTSSAHYAAGLLDADALTINSYLGVDGMQPFIDAAAAQGRGLFVLVRTSNPGGDALQSLALQQGGTVAEHVGQMVADSGEAHCGESGYSLVGAVVGATKPADARLLRSIMPKQLFLVPGFGAQGGGAEDVRACFNDDGRGAIITASRSVIYAYASPSDGHWRDAIRDAAIDLTQQIAAIRG